MTRLARALALAGAMALGICGASAQQFPSGSIQGNAGATAAPPRAITPSAWHDRWCSLTQFAFPVRGASSWSCAVLAAGVQAFLVTPSSANLIAALTDETGTGAAVFATSPTLVTPNLGTPSAGVATNITGLPIATGVSGLGAGIATFLATPSSANLATAVTGDSGTGALLFSISPSLQTPILGVATATSVNKMAITAPATSSTLAVADGKTATVSNTLTFSGTDASSVAFGAGGTVAYQSRSIATGCGLAGGGDLSADRTLRLSLTINAQTGTSYTILDGDCGKLVTLSNGSAVAVTLPQAGGGGSFVSGWSVAFQNRGAGTVTITPTTSTINGGATLLLTQNQGMHCRSDGTNYSCVLGVGAGGGSGTVTNVAATYPLVTSPAPITATGTVSFVGGVACGRLTYTSATAIEFKPYNCDLVRIAGAVYQIPIAGIAGCINPTSSAMFVNGTASQNLAASTFYYVYAFINSATVTCDFRTDGNGHLPDSTAGNIGTEVRVSSGTTRDTTRTLIGMVRTNASSQFSDSEAIRTVATWFNRHARSGSSFFTANRTRGTASYAELNSEIRVQFLIWADETVRVTLNVIGFPGNVLYDDMRSAVSFDGGTVEDGAAYLQAPNTAQATMPGSISIEKNGLSEGFHYATLFGYAGAGNSTWLGSATPNVRTVLVVGFRG